MPDTFILGIESSCDETAAAVVRSGEQMISNVVASQIATHKPYGGVVPELASREHLRAIVPVVKQALAESGKTFEGIDALAVTQGPGLAGSLLVGISYAKALAYALDKPLIAVNHLEGHIHAVLLEERQKGNRELQFPVLALVVSGGHTHLYLAEQKGESWSYENIGHTRDDAAGEAFDKVAKLLGLGYPGGPVIDRLSKHGDPHAVKFPPSQIKHPDRRPLSQPSKNLKGATPEVSTGRGGGAAALPPPPLHHPVLDSTSPTAGSRLRCFVTLRPTTWQAQLRRGTTHWLRSQSRSWKITLLIVTSRR
jgi:N6-L-threonylcarbamoyladenine synthase